MKEGALLPGSAGEMLCDICGKDGATIHPMTRSYGKEATLLVIEDVPVVVCPHYGGSHLSAEVLHEIERIKLRAAATFASRDRQ